MQQSKKQGLVWFTNNLRIQDNESLSRACIENDIVIACYFFNPDSFSKDRFGFKKTEKYRAQFLIETVKNLQENLSKLNISLIIKIGKPSNEIPKLVKEFNCQNLYFQK